MSQPSPPPSPVALVDQHYYLNDIQVVDSLFINLLWGSVCLLLFVTFRGWLKGPGGVFQRRHELQDLFMRPPRMLVHTARQMWNWIMPMLAISDADIIRSNGFDALIMTRILLIGLQMMTLMTVLGVGVLIPVYYTRGKNVEGSAGVLALMSIANLEKKSKIGLVPFFCTYAFCICCCFVLWINCKCYVQLRNAYFLCLDALPQEETLAAAAAAEAAEAAATAAAGAAAGTAGQQQQAHMPQAGAVAESREQGGRTSQQPPKPGPASAGAGTGFDANISGGQQQRQQQLLRMEELLAQAEVAGGCAGGPPAYTGVDVYLRAAVQEQEMKEAGAGAAAPAAAAATGDVAAAAGLAPWVATRGGVLSPEMPLGSTWLNLGNFVNPALRMLLDHLDWMSPLQRAAAHYGIRNLRWPYPWSDQPPPYAWQYDPSRQPLLELDDEMEVRMNAVRRRRNRQRQLHGNGAGGGGSGKRGVAAGKAGGGGGGDDGVYGNMEVVMPAVLPYWRPSKLWRRLMAVGGVTDAATARSGSSSSGSGSHCVVGIVDSSLIAAAQSSSRTDSPVAVAVPLPAPPSQQQQHSSAAAAAAAACPVGWTEGDCNNLPPPPPLPRPVPAAASAAACVGAGAAGRGTSSGPSHTYLRRRVAALHAEATALASAAAAAGATADAAAGAAAAAAGPAGAVGDGELYVRHSNSIAQAVVAALAAGAPAAAPAASTGAGAAAAAAGGGAAADGTSAGAAAWRRLAQPLQPLLPGKRNARLTQLLRVPLQPLQSLQPLQPLQATDAPAAAPAGGAAAAIPTATATAAAAAAGSAPVRVVNASHYVVLLHRVTAKRGPDLLDRLAALGYVSNARLRTSTSRLAGLLGLRKRRQQQQQQQQQAQQQQPRNSYIQEQANAQVHRAPSSSNINSELRSANAQVHRAPSSSNINSELRSQQQQQQQAQEGGGGGGVDDWAPQQRGMKAVVQRYYRLFYDSGHEWRGEEARPLKAPTMAAAVAAAAVGGGARSPRGPVGEAVEGKGEEGAAAGGPRSAAAAAATATGVGGAGNSRDSDDDDGGGGGGGGGGGVGRGQHLWRSPALGLKRTETARIEADLHEEARAAAEQEAAAAAEADPNGAAVAAQLKRLFPGSFLGLVPVTNHDEADKLIYEWDMAMQHLADSMYDLRVEGERAAAAANAHMLAGGGGGGGDVEMGGVGGSKSAAREQQAAAAASPRLAKLRADVEKQQAQVVELEVRIEEARQRALVQPTGFSYFALFNSSQDAQLLAQCRRVVPPRGPGALLSFDVMPAPAPDDVNWSALWVTRGWERALRGTVFWIPLVITFLIPIGPLQGALTSLTTALCSGTSSTGAGNSSTNGLYVAWWCETNGFAMRLLRAIVTGIMPSVIGFLWETFAMPQFLFFASNIRRRPVSLNGVEREIQAWFWWYALLNTFIGAVLGGGIFSQVGTFLEEGPGNMQTLQRVGTGVVDTANFFIQLVIARALFTNCLKIVFPHEGSMFTSMFRSCLCMCRPKNMRVSAFIHQPPSLRSATLYNFMMSVMLFGFAYAVISPIILPCCWFYFLTGFISYRYNLVNFYERGYDSGGRMWPALFGQLVGLLVVLEVLTGTVLLTNQSWELAAVMWGTLTPALAYFWASCNRTYLEPLKHPPLSLVAREPQGCVSVDPLVYVPCAIRPGALGWYPEQGKVWQKYALPKHHW